MHPLTFPKPSLVILCVWAGCKVSDPLPPTSAAEVALSMLADAQTHYQHDAGRFGNVNDLFSSGYLRKEKFNGILSRAVGFQFSLQLDADGHDYRYTAVLEGGPSPVSLYVDGTGAVKNGSSKKDGLD